MIIKSIQPLGDCSLSIHTEDGKKGIFDVRPYLVLEAFEGLNDPEEFNKVTNGKYYIEWASGADLSADTIEAHLIYN